MRSRRIICLLPLAAFAALWGGCATPMMYRQDADGEVGCILQQQGDDERWYLPETNVDIPIQSRNFDPAPPDCPPMPPDDPAAHRYMHCPSGQPGYKHWHADGDSPAIESEIWREFLITNEEGELELSTDQSFNLALLNNRDFQTQLENVYLTALQLTFERFEFDLQWIGINRTEYLKNGEYLGDRAGQQHIRSASLLGFSKSFAAGGELLASYANAFVWEFSGSNSRFAVSNLTLEFIQPLLRGAFRDIRLENLTQAERNVLYAIRDFARFRKQFYVDVVSGQEGYLNLLLNLQAIRNLEQNLIALEQNLREHEALAEAGFVSTLQVDQVFQSYQAGRLALIRARNRMQNALDSYKIQLGVPPEFPVLLDDSQLDRFQFTSDAVVELEQSANDSLQRVRLAEEAFDAETLQSNYELLQQQVEQLLEQIESVDVELQTWERNVEKGEHEGETDAREKRDQGLMRERLSALRRSSLMLQQSIQQSAEEQQLGLSANTRLERLVRSMANQISDLYVIQTQVRTYLIKLETLEVSESDAVKLALDRRLDLSNQQATVVDAWRKIRVAKDALEADLDVFARADIATQGDSTNPVDFSSRASIYRLGFELDGPLNRLAERNNYRAELINYQRARRDWIGLRDGVVQAVRRDLRDLEAEKLNFEISRQSLVAAARQVEQARLQLLAPDQAASDDSSRTRDALNALDTLLAAKNSLIASWVAYETARYQLLLDIESLDFGQYGFIGDNALVTDAFHTESSPTRSPVGPGDDWKLFGPANR